MIKGIYSLKSLKRCLFGLLISCIMVVGNYSNSAYLSIGGGAYTSAGSQDFTITAIKGGNFLSNYVGQGKGLLAWNMNNLAFWSTNGDFYLYTPYSQGYFGEYWLCNELTGTDSTIQNCTQYSLVSNPSYKTTYVNFFKSLQNNDLVYYYFNTRYDAYYPQYQYDVCWSSSDVHRSLCFRFKRDVRSQGCLDCYGTLTGSLNLPNSGPSQTTFSNISTALLSYAPGQGMYQNNGEIVGGSTVASGVEMTGDVITRECTKQWARAWYSYNGYTIKLCYGGLNDFSTATGTLPLAGQGLDVEEIRFNTNTLRAYGQSGSALDYSERFAYWRDVYEIYKKNRDISNPFNGVPTVILTYFGFIDAYGLAYTNSTILEYCDLALYTSDLEVSYEGINKGTICSSSLVSFVDQSTAQMNGTSPIIGSSWEGITDRSHYQGDGIPGKGTGSQSSNSSGITTYSDGSSFENSFFNLVKNSFRFPTDSGSGALPSYILIALVGLVVFRFLMH